MKVLLIEDAPGDRRLFEEHMGETGIMPLRITAVARLQDAIESLRATDGFDVAFLDLGLPDAEGLGALARLREADWRLPVIILTGRDEEQLSLNALEQGAQDYLLKDHLSPSRLRQSIAFAMHRRSVEEALRTRERESQQAQKLEAIGQLAAGIAHEINTPMQYIGDNLLFLRDAMADLEPVLHAVAGLAAEANDAGPKGDRLSALAKAAGAADVEYLLSEIPEALEQSTHGVERVSKIVRAMKEFSHPGSEEMRMVDLQRGLESTVTVCRSEWKYVADVEVDVPADLPAVPCFPGDVNQVFLNLVVNAAHAIAEKMGENPGEKGRIRITARKLDGFVEVCFEDDGVGIPDDVRGKVFEPFFTTKEVGRGTGQGLSFAYNVIVEKHRGSLSFESEVGKGTRFVVRLPLDAERSGAPAVL